MGVTHSLGEFVVSSGGTSSGISGTSEVAGPHEVLDADSARLWAEVYLKSGWAVTAGPGLNESGVCSCRLKDACRTPGKHEK